MKHLPIYSYLIIFFWFVFLAYWGISGLKTKRNINTPSALRGGLFRLVIGVVVVVVLSQNNSFKILTTPITNPALNIIGVVLCGLGIGFAIWARYHIGRNWGMPMSVKENPELVTSGPYRYIRHPIYTGVIFALLGTALDNTGIVFVIFLLFATYFIYSAVKEEKAMMQEFPEQYPAYKQKTKMIIPLIF